MDILFKVKLERRITKSKSKGNILLVLFDNSSEFALLEIHGKRLEILYYHDLGFVILDGCFSTEDSIWFAGLKSQAIEWDFKEKKVLRQCGEIIFNKLDADLSGYSSICTIPEHQLLVAANLGSCRLEFFRLDTLVYAHNGIALTEVYTKQICLHPCGYIIAVLITDSEDTGKVRFFELGLDKILLYTRYIHTFFAPGGLTYDLAGGRLIVGGGFPPFSYQIHEFPSLNVVNEFIDDTGSDIAEPWGDSNGISFNSDMVFKDEGVMYVPYFNGNIVTLEINTGKIVQSFKCNSSPSVSLSRLGSQDCYACSSITGEICLLRLDGLMHSDTKEPIHLEDQTTTDHLLCSLNDMEEFAPSSDNPLLISTGLL